MDSFVLNEVKEISRLRHGAATDRTLSGVSVGLLIRHRRVSVVGSLEAHLIQKKSESQKPLERGYVWILTYRKHHFIGSRGALAKGVYNLDRKIQRQMKRL